jgi:hypothetical protein
MKFKLARETFDGIETFRCMRCDEIYEASNDTMIVISELSPYDNYDESRLEYSMELYCKDCVNDCGCPKKPFEE